MTEMPKIIIAEADGLCFGDYSAKEKIKVNDFAHMGDVYSLRAHNLVTRLEKNGELLFESVPGVAIFGFDCAGDNCRFEIESPANVQITLGMAPETKYDLAIGTAITSQTHEEITANRSGKLSFGVQFEGEKKKVALQKL